jgi:hypothetical protein
MPGEMQCAFEQLLSCAGTVSHKTLKFPNAASVAASILKPEIERVYRSLDGILWPIRLNLRHWDMEFDGIAVELDEYLHFNRYRKITLESASYERLPRFPLKDYQCYCSKREERCLKAGGYRGKWSNKASEAQFGKASQPKDLSGKGSPRWKQRAFYDFIKDLSPLLIHVPVVRVAVWDTVKVAELPKTVEEILTALIRKSAPTAAREASSAALADLVKERAAD